MTFSYGVKGKIGTDGRTAVCNRAIHNWATELFRNKYVSGTLLTKRMAVHAYLTVARIHCSHENLAHERNRCAIAGRGNGVGRKGGSSPSL